MAPILLISRQLAAGRFIRKEKRIEGHIFITVLAYHILNTMRYQLRERKIFMFWKNIRKMLSTLIIAATTLKTKDGHMIYIRNTSKLEEFHKEIFNALGLKLSIITKRKTII